MGFLSVDIVEELAKERWWRDTALVVVLPTARQVDVVCSPPPSIHPMVCLIRILPALFSETASVRVVAAA